MGSVYRFLVHLTRDEPRAEDLTQETFAAAWRGIGSFAGRSGLGTWLHRIAYGKFIDARNANWQMMVDPKARFSPDAIRDLLSKDFRSLPQSAFLLGAQELGPRPVPEPATLVAWIVGASAIVVARRTRAGKAHPPQG